ncbi:MAG: hypothetical protein ABI790_18770 [Betaproteobacteria bacterium]
MLDLSLILIAAIFCLIMAGILAFCLRTRKHTLANLTDDAERDRAEDSRVAVVLFGAIIVGALLALITMYLVFFRQWA